VIAAGRFARLNPQGFTVRLGTAGDEKLLRTVITCNDTDIARTDIGATLAVGRGNDQS
jgi:hypothetical protein